LFTSCKMVYMSTRLIFIQYPFIMVELWEHFNDGVLPVSLVKLKRSLFDKVSIRLRKVIMTG